MDAADTHVCVCFFVQGDAGGAGRRGSPGDRGQPGRDGVPGPKGEPAFDGYGVRGPKVGLPLSAQCCQ